MMQEGILKEKRADKLEDDDEDDSLDD